jgi:Glycosyl transferase family 2
VAVDAGTASPGAARRSEEAGRRSVSVAMATHNGAEFLEPQLASIAAQSRTPTELVVCDDGSSDGTVEVITSFARQAPFEVRLFRNEERLGFGENFMKAARLCRSHAIAWSDQDDVWMPEKLARCLEAFEQDPDIVMVVHSTQIGDRVKRGTPLVKGPLARYESRRSEARILRRRSVFTPAALPLEVSAWGHSCVVSRRVVELGDALATVVPGVIGEFSGHDTWTSFVATAAGKVALLPEVLVQYRQHAGQVAGAAAPRAVATRVKQSAGRSRSAALEDLEGQATRAFFRASVLTQLAATLETEAGFGRGAASFRAALDAQVVEQREVGFARGALARGGMWHRRGEIVQRRLQLWSQAPASRAAVTCLVRNLARGDYRRAARGGLGGRALARDLWRLRALTARRRT